MLVDNTQENIDIRDTCATLALEDMFLPDAFIKETMKVSSGEKTSEELRQEVIKQYAG